MYTLHWVWHLSTHPDKAGMNNHQASYLVSIHFWYSFLLYQFHVLKEDLKALLTNNCKIYFWHIQLKSMCVCGHIIFDDRLFRHAIIGYVTVTKIVQGKFSLYFLGNKKLSLFFFPCLCFTIWNKFKSTIWWHFLAPLLSLECFFLFLVNFNIDTSENVVSQTQCQRFVFEVY